MTLPEYIAWMDGFMMADVGMPCWYKEQIKMKLELLKASMVENIPFDIRILEACRGSGSTHHED